jgi:acetyl esterase/lipase
MDDTAKLPAALYQWLADIGPRWAEDVPGNVRQVVQQFSPLLAQAPKDGVEVLRDLPYGGDERHRLDVFTPGRKGRLPVVLFLHGGAFVDGHRNRSDEIYANVLYYFARHGCVGINMEYRLAPEHAYPSGIEDVARAVQWVRGRIREFGGDPGQIYLMGHSAGAAHAAGYAYDRRHHPAGGAGLAGLIVVSGRVRADNGAENPNARKVEAYYGTDARAYEDVSPVSHVRSDSLPTMVAFAEYENPLIDVYCLELACKLASAKRRAPRVAYARGHNHTSIIARFNTAEDDLGPEILAFMRDCALGKVH